MTTKLKIVHCTDGLHDLSGRMAVNQVSRISPVLAEEHWVVRSHPYSSVEAHLRVTLWIAVVRDPHTSNCTICRTVGCKYTITDLYISQTNITSIIAHEHPRVATPADSSHHLLANVTFSVCFFFLAKCLLQ
jgi:hypothetical protein